MSLLKNENVVVHELDDELVLYDPQAERTHRLNACATVIYRHCDGHHDVEAIARIITERFDVEFDRALPDTRAALDQLASEHLVVSAA